MGHRRARKKEATQQVGAPALIISRHKLSGAAALICLLGACGGAGDMASAGSATTGPGATTPGSAAAGANAVPSTAGVAGAVKTPGTAATQTGTPAGGSSQSPDGTAQMQGAAAAAAGGDGAPVLPCNVSKVLASNCQTCHGKMPIGGAPMSLVTYADLQAPAKTQPTMKVYELAKQRIHDMKRPMPPVGTMAPADVAALDAWFDGGALAGGPSDASCMATVAAPGSATGNKDGMLGRLTPGPGETCYEFKVHDSTTSVDDKKFAVDGEQYEQFYYKVPWPEGTVATAYATVPDNAAILHHWLLFATNENEVDGAHHTAPLPTLLGTDPVLLAGWAVGGPDLVMPKDVGMELPTSSKVLNVQWHFYNSTGKTQLDASSVQICTIPAGIRPNTGAISWLGTEDLDGNVWTGGSGMPPHQMSTFTTTCTPGMKVPIHIMGFEPHMHRTGKRMMTKVNHMDGTSEVIFDEPFSFGNETHYFKAYDLKAGETLTTSCTFNNDTDHGVPFGESTDAEMCYQFTFHYPAHALDNGAFSLLGVTDTCW